MRILLAGAMLLLAGACVAARAQEPEGPRTKISILAPEIATGAFAIGVTDLHFEPDWEWQALVCRRRCALQPVKLLMTPVKVHPYDGEPEPGHTYALDRELESPPLLLLRDLPAGVREKPETWLHAGLGTYPASSTVGTLEIDIPVPGDPARIVPRYAGVFDGTHRFHLYLESKSSRQLLARIPVDGIVGPSGIARGPQLLRWAGDLDGDDKLDLIMTLSSRTGEDASATLFLSTAAKDGEMVGMAATFYYWPVGNPGC
jgi:hypothetical protein